VLDQRIDEIAFEDAPFEQVMEWVAEYSKMNISVRWQQLEDLGVDRDKTISVSAKNLRLSQILWMIMNEAGGTDVKLAYRAQGDLLVMSTEEDLGQEMLVRVYDVSDLLVEIKDFTSAPQIDFQQISQQVSSGSGGGGGGQSIFGNDSSNDDDDDNNDNEDDEDIRELINLIQATISPDSWTTLGGTGTIEAFRNQLVVRNNILVHQHLCGAIEVDK